MASTSLRVRLRTQSGDIGPLDVGARESVGELKSRLLADWNRLTADGPAQTETPTAIACIKIILNGKFLDNDEVVSDLQQSLTDPAEHTVLTMHLIVRPSAVGKSPAKAKDKDAVKTCCVIC